MFLLTNHFTYEYDAFQNLSTTAFVACM